MRYDPLKDSLEQSASPVLPNASSPTLLASSVPPADARPASSGGDDSSRRSSLDRRMSVSSLLNDPADGGDGWSTVFPDQTTVISPLPGQEGALQSPLLPPNAAPPSTLFSPSNAYFPSTSRPSSSSSTSSSLSALSTGPHAPAGPPRRERVGRGEPTLMMPKRKPSGKVQGRGEPLRVSSSGSSSGLGPASGQATRMESSGGSEGGNLISPLLPNSHDLHQQQHQHQQQPTFKEPSLPSRPSSQYSPTTSPNEALPTISLPSDNHSTPFSSSSSSGFNRPPISHPMSHSPALSSSSRSSASSYDSHSEQHHQSSPLINGQPPLPSADQPFIPPRPTRLLYNPIRKTPARSVQVALPLDEYNYLLSNPASGSKNPLRGLALGSSANGSRQGSVSEGGQQGNGSYGQKRPWEGGDEGTGYGDRRRRAENGSCIPAGDVSRVAQHYNSRPEIGKNNRQFSPIIGLKSFNNWIKSVLIAKFARRAIPGGGGVGGKSAPPRGRVLDLGCGKGGDLNKWNQARVAKIVAFDIADVSVQQAQGRVRDMRTKCFEFEAYAMDCFSEPISSRLPVPRLESEPFDLTTMQFCMHYAFETEEKVRQMLENATKYLKPGGVFLGTIPNAEKLKDQLNQIPDEAEELTFGNSVFNIRFDDRTENPLFGHRYSFYLQDAVEDVPEYLVDWDNFEAMALEYNLRLLYKKDFEEIFNEEQAVPEFSDLLKRMKVVNDEGSSEMTGDQWEACNLYLGFAFERV